VVPGKSRTKEEKKNDNYSEKKYWIKWNELLKRVFKKDALICHKCGHSMKIVADITDPEVIKKILKALDLEDSTYTINDRPRVSHSTYYPSD
jgi:hypothetical protein